MCSFSNKPCCGREAAYFWVRKDGVASPSFYFTATKLPKILMSTWEFFHFADWGHYAQHSPAQASVNETSNLLLLPLLPIIGDKSSCVHQTSESRVFCFFNLCRPHHSRQKTKLIGHHCPIERNFWKIATPLKPHVSAHWSELEQTDLPS